MERLGKTKQGILVLRHTILAFPGWPLWEELVGIEDRSFGYHIGETLRVEVADADHPITAGLTDWERVDATCTTTEPSDGNQLLLTTARPHRRMDPLMESILPATFVVLCLLPSAPLAAESRSVVAPGATIERLAGDFKFTEGPAADAAGNVFFTDQPNDRIMKWGLDGKLSTFLQPCGRSNGLYFGAAGNLLACADEKNELWSIAPDSEVTVLVKDYEGKLLNGPNDLWVHPSGAVYFTDPLYKRPYWKRDPARQQDCEGVYRLSADRKTLARVVADLMKPNGLIGTPDGKRLYIADLGAKKTFAYDLAEDGTLLGKRLFCEMGSDGMTLDSEGNVYLTGKGVTVFDKAGKKIDHLAVPEGWTANVCFGSADRQTLFITASKGLYAVRMRVKGVR